LFVGATIAVAACVGSLATGCSLVVSTSGLADGPPLQDAGAPDAAIDSGSDDATRPDDHDSFAGDSTSPDAGALPDTGALDTGGSDADTIDAGSADSNAADAPADSAPADVGARDSSGAVTTTDLTPSQDAYVQDTPYADTNFGTNPQLIVKTRSMPGTNRNTWLSFDIAGFTGITAAKLRLYVNSLDTANTNTIPVVLYYPPDSADSWTEATITWNNAPSYGTNTLGTVNVSDPQIGTWIEFDVTGAVAADANGIATFVLTSTPATNRGAIFESSRGTASPVLRITGVHP
jgi:hypothetical protein